MDEKSICRWPPMMIVISPMVILGGIWIAY
jgi:hypothetical protein